MNNRSPEERLAQLEARLDNMRDHLDQVQKTLAEMVRALERYRGAVGLFLFLVSAITSATALIVSWLRGSN